MLLQFTVENFKSFDAPTSFSMRATRDKDHPSHVMRAGKESAVKAAAFFGANASGKSNLVLAMLFAQDLIRKGRRAGQRIPLEPFALRPGGERTSGFHWQFVHQGKKWSYGFDLTPDRVAAEYLYARDVKGGRETRWFDRTTEPDSTSRVVWGAALRGGSGPEQAGLSKFLERSLRPEQPLLTHAIDNQSTALRPVWDWFTDVLLIVRADSRHDTLLPEFFGEDKMFNSLSQFLNEADTGIEEVEPETLPYTNQVLRERGISGDLAVQLEKDIEDLGPGSGILVTHGWEPFAVTRFADGQLGAAGLKAVHRNDEQEKILFPLSWESEGTQSLIHLIPRLLTMANRTTVLVVDELDRRLHSLLTRQCIEFALTQSTKTNSQLLFTTHDVSQLDRLLLRRDEIWFVQKERGRSALSTLAEFKVRSELDYQNAYLVHRFDGTPNFAFPFMAPSGQEPPSGGID